jgi:DNA topoisomerase-2
MSSKLLEEKFKKLDEIEHCLLRPGRYLGAINPHTAETFVVDETTKTIVRKENTWIPALLKIFDEVISNSVDFSKTAEGKNVSTIRVDIDKVSGEISVFDDGGIVVHKHAEYDQWIPEMIFELRAGSNFNDDEDSTLTGQNGEGAALTSIFSKEFRVKTADGKKQFDQIHYENSRKKTEPKIKESSKHFTEITFTPDYEKFGLTGLDDGNYAKLVKRVYDIAGCNPKLKVYLNGQVIKIKDFEDYIKMYTDQFVYESNEHWKVGVAQSDGFEHVSFVNSTETNIGGGHIHYIRDQIIVKLREYFQKKHKVDVKPSDISNHLMLFIDATINKPRYSSQTKDELITEIKAFGTSIELSDKFIRKLLVSPIIQSILDWIAAKEAAANAAKARLLNKTAKSDPKNVEKFIDATTKNRNEAILFLTEGDCFDENLEVSIIEDGEYVKRVAKDLKIGDLVITHNNNVREITNVFKKLGEFISINGVRYSPTHRLYTYDTQKCQFEFVMVKDIDMNIHKLVKSRLKDMLCCDKIELISKSNNMFTLTSSTYEYISSPTHKWRVFDMNLMTFCVKEAQELTTNDCFILCKV